MGHLQEPNFLNVSVGDLAGTFLREPGSGFSAPRYPEGGATWPIQSAYDALLDQIHERLPCAAVLSGFGSVLYDRFVIDHVLGRRVPDSYVAALLDSQGELASPVLQRCLALRKPVFVNAENALSIAGGLWRTNFISHGFRNCVVDAVTDPMIGRFCFASVFDLPSSGAEAVCTMRAACTLPVRDFWRREFAMLHAQPQACFSPAERELLHHLGQGKTNKQIARELSKSVATIRSQVHHLLEKTDASNRTELAIRYAGDARSS